MAELVDALDLGSSVFDVRVRVSPSALVQLLLTQNNPQSSIAPQRSEGGRYYPKSDYQQAEEGGRVTLTESVN